MELRELYRSPAAEPPDEVARLDPESRELSETEQQAWANRTIERNRDAHQQAADQAARGIPRVGHQEFSITERRAALGEAILAHTLALHAAHAADLVVERARLEMDKADHALHGFDNLDQQVTDYTIAALKAGMSTALPQELLDARRLRAECVDNSRDRHLAYGHLVAEAQAARARVDQAAADRNACASAVLHAHGDMLARQLAQLETQVAVLRQQVRSTGDCWLVLSPGNSKSVGLSNLAREILLKPRTDPEASRDYARALIAWYESLQSNADAELL